MPRLGSARAVVTGLVAAVAAAMVFGAAAVVQAIAVRRVPHAPGLHLSLLVRLLREPMFVAALILNVAGFILHLAALRSLPLFLAQSVIAASLAITAILAVRVFAEPLVRAEWVAVLAVCLGLVLLAASAGDQGHEGGTAWAKVGALGAVAAVALIGYLAARCHGAMATALLGLVAGLGFALVAVTARLLEDLLPASLARDPATYALFLAGILALLLYSLALQRGSVTTATAPMVLAQTVAPAVIGVLLLGDDVRDGWGLVAVVGFVLAAGGVTELARFEHGRTPPPAAPPAQRVIRDEDTVVPTDDGCRND